MTLPCGGVPLMLAGYCHDVTEPRHAGVTLSRGHQSPGSDSAVATQPFETSQIDENEDNCQLLTETDCSLLPGQSHLCFFCRVHYRHRIIIIT